MYNAFISYSHAADSKLAPALQDALETFAKPWYKVRYLNIFRDEDSLTAAPHLWSNIEAALAQSEYLIYMASPLSASSKWAAKEVEYWVENKSIDKLLIVLTDGDIVWDDATKSFLNKDKNSLPDVLEKKFTEEPFYIDLRFAHTQQDISLRNPIFKKEVLKLAAQLHGKEPKDLASEEVSAHSKVILIRNTMIAVLTLLLIAAIGAAWFANSKRIEANEKTQEAKESRDRADSSAAFAILQSKIAQEQRDSAIIARRQADNSAIVARLQKDTAQIERDNALTQEQIAVEQKGIAVNQKEIAEANYLLSEAKGAAEYDPTTGLRLAEAALQKRNTPAAEEGAYKIYRENSFYKIIAAHHQTIHSIAFSKDGKYILSASRDSTAKLWTLDGKLVKEFKDPSQLFCAAISPDGKYVVTGSRDGVTRLWNMNGKIIKEYKGNSFVEAVAFSPDGKYILTGSYDSTARLWNFDGKLLTKFSGHRDQVTSVAFSPSGKSVLTGSYDGSVGLWDINGTKLRSLKNNAKIFAVAFSPTGKNIIAGTSDGLAKMWDLNGKLLQEFKGHTDAVVSVAFSPDGKFILTGSWDNTARLWDMEGEAVEIFKGNPTMVTAIFSPDGKSILTGGGGTVSMYATPLDHTIRLWQITKSFTELNAKSPVMSVAFSPSNTSMLTGSLDKTTRLWDIRGRLLKEFSGDSAAVNSVAFSSDGKFILTGSLDDTARLWAASGVLIRKFAGHTGSINNVCFSPDNKLILTSSEDGTARLWDINGNTLQVYPQETNVRCALFSPGGNYILTATNSWGKMAKMWDLHGKLVHEYIDITYSAMGVITLAFAPGGKSFAAATGENKLWLWSLDGKLIKEFPPQPQSITSVKFSPDGHTILTGSIDGIARLWNLQGFLLQEFKGQKDGISSVDFSGDGKYVIAGSYDGTARVWNVLMPLQNFIESNKIEALTTEQKEQYGIR